MITCGTPTGWLDVDNFPLHGPAVTMPNLLGLWMGGDVRGADRIIPGLAGAIPYRRRWTSTRHSLPLTLCGDVDFNGNRYEIDPWAGLLANVNTLRQYVVDPTNIGDGTRLAKLHLPDDTIRQAYIHVLRLVEGEVGQGTQQDGATGVVMRATLEISIPRPGVFV